MITRRQFIGQLAGAIPVAQSLLKKRRRTVVQVIRAQNPDGSWSEAWSEVKPPNGRKAWTAAEIKKYGYKVIERPAE